MKTFLIIIVTVLSCVTAGAQVKIGDSPFYEAMRELPLQEREQMICKEILSGNVPEYMYGFIAIKTIQRDAAGKKHRVTLYVKPDYLTIGGNNNTVPFIIPMTPRTAQQIADSLDCSLPTPKIVDLIYLAAKMKLNPFNYIPRGVRNSDPDLFFDHSQVIFAQVKAAGGTPGQLVAGSKKDVVISAKLSDPQRTHHVIIYGWHKTDGKPIQPEYNGHIDSYVDYSHGIRLVSNKVLIDGKEYRLHEILQDPQLFALLCYEPQPLTRTGYYQAQSMFYKYTGQDIANPKLKGSYLFDNKLQVFTLQGCSYFVSQPVEGDFIISANLKFTDTPADPGSTIGLMILGSDSEKAFIKMKETCFVQLERKGNEVILRTAKKGRVPEETARELLNTGETVLAGMFVSSAREDIPVTAEFSNVRIEKPAGEGVDGYRNPSPSRLEILDVGTGLREVVYQTNDHIEAPNWSRDGKFLIYNSEGKLYRFDLEKRVPELINSGTVTANNNDHGISFNGEMLAVSSASEVNGKYVSVIYTLPVQGGTPKQITPVGPSYWHGWSPDDQWITYCAERNGNYDVYKMPSRGGEEIRLTTAGGLDDGPEYSPDGKYIYFNSTRTGSMQIWRMKPDGSDQQQVTSDRFQNWFAHPSPDGKQLIMISYPPEVPAESHPHNQRVLLRTMPIDGKEPTVAAILYGGQGTLNVPSWSPDSKKVAFVSYTY